MTDHYANAYSTTPGECFRLVTRAGEGQPTQCPNPVALRGRWRDGRGRLRDVESCMAHSFELEEIIEGEARFVREPPEK